MKKLEKVSIADISFTLDNDAYASLRSYLGSLHDYYDSDPDGGEIIADIEARIAELILNEQIYTKIVSKRLIDSIIAQLGTPQEMGDDQVAGRRAARVSQAERSIPRRLYRSREGKILGGVCSGMAQFWNVNVVWIRLLFLAPLVFLIFVTPFGWSGPREFFLGCSWGFLIIYIVLCMAIPMARTPRQKLESRGEKITPSSIRQNLQENARTPSAKKAASVFAEILAVIGRILLFLIKLFVAFIGFSLLLSAVAIFFIIIVALINPATLAGITVLSILSGMSILSPVLFIALVLFCIMIPLWVVGTALLGLVFNRRPGALFYGILLGIWLLAMVFGSVVAVSNARFLRDGLRDGCPMELFETRMEKIKAKMDKTGLLMEFLRREDNGINNININVAGDSVEIISWRDHSADSTYVSPDGVLKYRSRIVLRGESVIGKALLEREKRTLRNAGIEISKTAEPETSEISETAETAETETSQ